MIHFLSVLVHSKIYDEFVEKLIAAYKSVCFWNFNSFLIPQITIGDPSKEKVLCGPLHTKKQFDDFHASLKQVPVQGGKVSFADIAVSSSFKQILYGGDDPKVGLNGHYVSPAIVEVVISSLFAMPHSRLPTMLLLRTMNSSRQSCI